MRLHQAFLQKRHLIGQFSPDQLFLNGQGRKLRLSSLDLIPRLLDPLCNLLLLFVQRHTARFKQLALPFDLFSRRLVIQRKLGILFGKPLNTYVDEVLASSFTTDVADNFVWETVEKSYDATGALTEQTTDYDNGRLLETLYSAGARTTAIMTDVEDAYAWANYVDTFDTNGDLATRLMTFDDGREVFTDYLG